MPHKTTPTPKVIDQTIRKNLHRLRKPGVLTVRPGFEIAKHQLTGKSAIVATVHTKKATLPDADRLPDKIAGIPVDVREATPHQRLRAHDPAAAELTEAYSRPEEKDPVWTQEREMPSGRLLTSAQSTTQKLLTHQKSLRPAATQALKSHSKKPEIDYSPAGCPALAPVSVTTTITAHVSPDAGLVTLEKFLAGTQKSLVVGMYDFTSGEILKKFESVLGGNKALQMVLDNPAPNPTRDQTDVQTVEDLDEALGSRAKITRALVRSDVYAAAWIFPYAYHIKVAVRDGGVFWLSSGNFNNSNQPDLASPPKTEDRDWHVIIEDQGLAQTFSAYLNYDYQIATQHQAAQQNAAAAAGAVSDARSKLALETNPPAADPLEPAGTSGYVPAKVFKDIAVTITPLLTPDVVPGGKQGQYLTNITKLISSAQKSLYIQLQYIESSSGSGDYDALLRTIADRVAAGVDVRLIESAQYGEKWAEKMKAAGVDLTANIRLQPDVHNKGFVVDSKTVVVSSQNFSPAGVQQNRDAGVIIESEQIAQYFEPIFVSDWEHKAKPFVAKPGKPASARKTSRTTGPKKTATNSPKKPIGRKRG